MTPKEKAEEIFNKYANEIYQRALTVMQYEICKQCALIAVDEIIKSNAMLPPNLNWQKVKKEIEAL
jgi:predicted proteasome-type protease